MSFISNKPAALMAFAMLAAPATAGLAAQQQESGGSEVLTTVHGADGPEIQGIISARSDNRIQVTANDGTKTVIVVSDETQIKGTGGFLGMSSKKLDADMLISGLPVTVDTWMSGDQLVASTIKFKNNDLKTAAMIRNGTAQRFAEHDVAIGKNSAAIDENARATEALRGRLGDIDKYNLKATTNVYFASGKADLSPQARNDLCDAAAKAEAMENSLMLVVGYTDSTGSYEVNQALSEKRATRVVNYLQQACGWKPYRMLTPTGMAASDPLVSNDTAEGRAQNRRVSVNVLVSKGLDTDEM